MIFNDALDHPNIEHKVLDKKECWLLAYFGLRLTTNQTKQNNGDI
jgi:hypothetical protein